MSIEETVATFSAELRRRGRRVGIEEGLDATKALKLIGNSDSALFSAAIKATLIKDFDLTLGDVQRRIRPEGAVRLGADQEAEKLTVRPEASRENAEPKNGKSFEFAIYSPLELNPQQKSLEISKAEERRWFRAINKFRSSILTLEGHRFRGSRSGLINLRQTLQLELKKAGDSPVIFRSTKKISKANVVLLCDVSGSMNDSNSKIVNLCCSVKRAIPKSEIFLFSTKLKRITYYAQQYNPRELASRIPKLDLDFGGGTRIGQCLRQFRQTYGHLLTRKTTVVIFSDGWDIGDISTLKHEIRDLRKRTNKIFWINPFLDSKSFSVETIGMKVALEYVDSFISPEDLLLGKVSQRSVRRVLDEH